jgi:glucose-6-phosphate-specific signal transduction histidine kinase
MVRLTVEDDGVGFNVEEALARRDSFGLSGMRERVALLGGRFEVRSWPPGAKSGDTKGPGGKRRKGTKIQISLPLGNEGRNAERTG